MTACLIWTVMTQIYQYLLRKMERLGILLETMEKLLSHFIINTIGITANSVMGMLLYYFREIVRKNLELF